MITLKATIKIIKEEEHLEKERKEKFLTSYI